MKRFIVYTLMLVSLNNVYASDIAKKLLLDKNIPSLIASLNKAMDEIKEKKVRYVSSTVTRGGNVILTSNFYTSEGQFYDEVSGRNVVQKYYDGMENLHNAHYLSSLSDGALLGCLLTVIAQCGNHDLKMSGSGIALSLLCGLLLNHAKYMQLDKVPYLTLPKLEENDNFFGLGTYMSSLGFVVGGEILGYCGATLLMNAIIDKI